MGKEEIFSKLNIKDYNNMLEKIIEKKSFPENTKNLLLNMLYKIETAYNDYKTIKVNVSLKKEILQEILSIIENECKSIELVNLNLENIDKTLQESVIIKEKNKIIVYPNDKMLLDALYSIEEAKFSIKNNYTIIRKSLENLLNLGNIMNKTEIIRDFDGWAWNIQKKEIYDTNINVIYQSIQILLGNQFLQNWMENKNDDDYIFILQELLTEKYGQEIGENIYNLLYKISIIIYISKDAEEKQRLILEMQIIEKELETMKNKEEYIQNLTNSKKETSNKIKRIDESLSNKDLLKEEFVKINKELKIENKIFSLSDFDEYLEQEREKLILELKLCSSLMEPKNYIKTKEELEQKLKFLRELNLEELDKTTTTQKENILIIAFQQYFLKAFMQDIEKSNTKKENIDNIYKLRYYKLLFINQTKCLYEIKELQESINNLSKVLITKACKTKTINILSSNIEENFLIISEILNTKIINLEEIILEFKKKDDNILLNIYEENIIDREIKYEKIEGLNVKYNKKIKLIIYKS